jgi:argininosuccinate lyase
MRAAAESDFSNATDVADYLVRKGMPFREAYGIVGTLVRYAIEKKKFLSELSLTEFTNHSPLFCDEIFNVLNLDKVVARRESEGGTSPAQVKHQLILQSTQQELVKNWLDTHEYACTFPVDSLFSGS